MIKSLICREIRSPSHWVDVGCDRFMSCKRNMEHLNCQQALIHIISSNVFGILDL